MPDDEEISYLALEVGTPALSSSGTAFGTVEHVLQVPELDLFDGVVVATHHGLRLVERDQIARITRSALHCSMSDEDAENLPPPSGPPVYHVDAFEDRGSSLTARLGRLFKREHWLREEDDSR